MRMRRAACWSARLSSVRPTPARSAASRRCCRCTPPATGRRCARAAAPCVRENRCGAPLRSSPLCSSPLCAREPLRQEEGNLERAEDLFTEALAHDPRDPDILLGSRPAPPRPRAAAAHARELRGLAGTLRCWAGLGWRWTRRRA